jgi:transposase-like protein
MREMSVAEQRYKAVLAVIADGRTVTEVARDLGVSRQTMHVWLARYEAVGLEGLSNRAHRPAHSPRMGNELLKTVVRTSKGDIRKLPRRRHGRAALDFSGRVKPQPERQRKVSTGPPQEPHSSSKSTS